ncbi:bifunctional hydroxymethylpyrimidine kinase/phosphomethylpyrimidine kinase [Marinospirillum insulare]|uniref:hydroxymethylpyrimidine kinase n=1 Tax=Marinospirillum insulare TaxID=217169 RepID=A0ABQ6A1U6_9GAMM|nr:hydroxymethylpyrimidine/phosphomethylpyrimidine kinase [Marinospirillum insulare]GLR64070.1 hydroxymethylpyrimidine/phosphomethylpyrimidine kinase [Marinospirillum insulare]
MIKLGVHPNFQKKHPPVLAIGGHDPSSGAGIIADAQAILGLGAWPITLISCLTAQNTQQVKQITYQPIEALQLQLEVLLADFTPAAIKLGVLGSLEVQELVAKLIKRYPQTSLVIDPVLASTSGTSFTSDSLIGHLKEEILPYATLITPNLQELEQLVPNKETVESQAQELIKLGCKAVLVTGVHKQTHTVRNLLFTNSTNEPLVNRWQRLEGEFHGSGCTLASAVAALLARGEALPQASVKAQDYTWQSLDKALKLTEGQLLPLRIREDNHA